MKTVVQGLSDDISKQIENLGNNPVTLEDAIFNALPDTSPESVQVLAENLIGTVGWVGGVDAPPITIGEGAMGPGFYSVIYQGERRNNVSKSELINMIVGDKVLDERKITQLEGLMQSDWIDYDVVIGENAIAELQERQQELDDLLDSLDSLLREWQKNNLVANLLNPVFAEDIPSEVDDKPLFFLPEYGTFTLEYGPFEYEKKVTDGKTIYIFYFELNGKKGIQLPKGEPKAGVLYDLLLESVPSQITYEQTASAKEVSLKKGINIISFDWLPAFSYEDIYTAKDFAKKVGGSTIEFIAYFESGRWSKGISCDKENTCFGDDFALTPGRGYLVRSSEDKEIMLPGFKITSEVPINFSTGWNLVGIHGYPKAFTAKTLVDSINKVEGLTADNVSWWPTSKGRYEGLQVVENTEYGLDFPISPLNGYFIRITDFKPEKE
jgi:hypothetical protein